MGNVTGNVLVVNVSIGGFRQTSRLRHNVELDGSMSFLKYDDIPESVQSQRKFLRRNQD